MFVRLFAAVLGSDDCAFEGDPFKLAGDGDVFARCRIDSLWQPLSFK
jgi:hypothetical protein